MGGVSRAWPKMPFLQRRLLQPGWGKGGARGRGAACSGCSRGWAAQLGEDNAEEAGLLLDRLAANAQRCC